MGQTFNDYAMSGFFDTGRYDIRGEILSIRNVYGQHGLDRLIEAVHAEEERYRSFIDFVKSAWPELYERAG